MSHTIRWRVGAFAWAIALAAGLIGWAASTSLELVAKLSERLTRVQIESFQTADQFRASVQELNNLLFRYQVNRKPEDWNRFLELWHDHDRWIDAQQPTLTSTEESRFLGLINDVYDDYFKAANLLNQPAGAPDAMERIQRETSRLLDLDNQLLAAHRASLTRFLNDSHRSLSHLRSLTLVGVTALLGLGAGLGVVIYREMIRPLRLQLVESTAIIAQHEKLASLGVLAAGVAHEIRNPLTAIKARLFTQQKRLSPRSREAEDAAFIAREIDRLEAIVKDFLQFARPADPRFELVHAETVLREVHDLLAPAFERQGIRSRFGAPCAAMVRADPQQLKQVLINLVQNAAESIGRDGTITLAVRTAIQRLRGQSTRVAVLEVADTGRGIPPDVQKRLFDPFFSTKEAGTGLGLSIALRIVEKHGGAIEFQTEPNRGTLFGVVLPLPEVP